MTEEMNELINIFNNVKNKEWIQSINKGSSSVGLTFEKEIEKPVDRLQEPDFKNIEIKCFKDNNDYLRCLFCAISNGNSNAEIISIKEKFGYPSKDLIETKVFCGDVCSIKKQYIGCKYLFKLKVSYKLQKVILEVYNKQHILIDNHTSWTFDWLKEKLHRKLKYLDLVEAESKYENFLVYFKYTHMTLFCFKNFNDFLSAITLGIISVTFTVGVFKSGLRKGETHDDGTEFRNHHKNLLEIYEKIMET